MLNTYPSNPFPPSTEQMHKGDNEDLQAQIDAIKDGTDIDSFGDVENALALKADTSAVNTALGAKCDLSNIAPTFDAEAGVYAVGDQVIYDGVLYEFTSAHSTAGDWDPAEAQAVKVSDLVDALKSDLNNLITTTSKLLTQAFTADQGITLYSTPGYVYKRGNSVTVHIKATGNATVGANGMLVLGVLNEEYRPSTMETIAATAYNPLEAGQRYTQATVRIETNGTCSLVTGLNAATIGNASYPWSTTLGIKFTFEIN